MAEHYRESRTSYSPNRYANSHSHTHTHTVHSSSPNRVTSRRRRPSPRSRKHGHSGGFVGHLIACAGEFVGTLLFLWFAFAWHETAITYATVVPGSPVPSAETIVFISIGYGFSLLVAAWAFYRISGGLFNPAVTLGLVLAGCLSPLRALFLLPAQIIGGVAAAGLVKVMFPYSPAVLNTTLASGVSLARGCFIEMFLTILLLVAVLMTLAVDRNRAASPSSAFLSMSASLAPLSVGLALFVAELVGVGTTGGSVNPARTFGPAVVTGVWVDYQWLYWVGPFLGSLVAAGIYRLVMRVDYGQVNPGREYPAGDFI